MTNKLDHTLLGGNLLYTQLLFIILQKEVPGWEIIQVSNEILKLAEQRGNTYM